MMIIGPGQCKSLSSGLVSVRNAELTASGLILSDTAWELYHAQLGDSYDPPVILDDNGQPDRAEWFKHLRIPERNVARFVHGYPILSEAMFCKTLAEEQNSPAVLAANDIAEPGSADWRWTFVTTEPMVCYVPILVKMFR